MIALKRCLWMLLLTGSAAAQGDGRLYVAGGAMGFSATVERALAQNPGGGRFFILVVGDAVRALSVTAPEERVDERRGVMSRGGSFLVCQRDIDRGLFSLIDLTPGVLAVRGWPQQGGPLFVGDSHYYADEDRSQLPAGESLRRLRATCS